MDKYDLSDKTVILTNNQKKEDEYLHPQHNEDEHRQKGQEDTNPLLAKFTHIICYIFELRENISYNKDKDLFIYCSNKVKEITDQLRKSHMDDNSIVTARYIVCGFIDEVVLNTPWGVNSQWTNQSLLSYFHKEVNSGEKFFTICQQLLINPREHLELLELTYTLLSLGYMGKYRFKQNGKSILSDIKVEILEKITPLRDNTRSNLSNISTKENIHAKKITSNKNLILLTFFSCLTLVLTIFSILLFKVNSHSDLIFEKSTMIMQSIKPPNNKRSPKIPPPRDTNWKKYVETDRLEGRLKIVEKAEEIKFIIYGNSLFSSGKSSTKNLPIFQNLAKAINLINGHIIISGHTDNIPMRSIKFPSNWALSKARADAVAQHIEPFIEKRKISSTGMADTRPLVKNDSKINRATNRRVEISIFTQQKIL